jgi:hypothetical protein
MVGKWWENGKKRIERAGNEIEIVIKFHQPCISLVFPLDSPDTSTSMIPQRCSNAGVEWWPKTSMRTEVPGRKMCSQLPSTHFKFSNPDKTAASHGMV